MLIPSHLQQNLMPSEVNFLAENEMIQILPRYSMKSIQLIGVCYFRDNPYVVKITEY